MCAAFSNFARVDARLVYLKLTFASMGPLLEWNFI